MLTWAKTLGDRRVVKIQTNSVRTLAAVEVEEAESVLPSVWVMALVLSMR